MNVMLCCWCHVSLLPILQQNEEKAVCFQFSRWLVSELWRAALQGTNNLDIQPRACTSFGNKCWKMYQIFSPVKKQRECTPRALLHPVSFLLFGSIKDHLAGLVTSPFWMMRYGLPLNFKDRATQLWRSRSEAFVSQWISEFSSSPQLWVWENKK